MPFNYTALVSLPGSTKNGRITSSTWRWFVSDQYQKMGKVQEDADDRASAILV